MVRRVLMPAAVMSVLLSGLVIGPAIRESQVTSSGHLQGIRRESWSQHDRAVYVVSTLNAVVCPSGAELPTLLSHEGARLFEVLHDTILRDVYYIRVRKADKRLLAVYVYRFGWTLPRGIHHYRCVKPAGQSDIVTQYRQGDWVFVARFTSTNPEG